MNLLSRIKAAGDRLDAKVSDYIKHNKSRSALILALSAAGIIGSFSVVSKLYENKIESMRGTQIVAYGTLEHPLYLSTIESSKFPTLEDTLRKENPNYDDSLSLLDSLRKMESILSERLGQYDAALKDAVDKKDRAAYDVMMSQVTLDAANLSFAGMGYMNLDEFDYLCKTLSANIISADKKLESIYGDPIDISKEIFSQVTGKDAPDLLNVQRENIKRKNVVGSHNPLLQKIVIDKNIDFPLQLNAGFHEFGHTAYQGQETLFFRHKGKEEEAIPMEEAAAYIFTMVCINEYEKREPGLASLLRFIETLERTGFVREYNQGSDEVHRTGAALADSILVYFNGDCSKAFNYLSTRNEFNELDPAIFATYKSYRESLPIDPKKLDEDINAQIKKNDELASRYTDLEKKYVAPERKAELIDLIDFSSDSK